MEEFYTWIIIILLIAIIVKLNQGNKKPSAKEIEKQRKVQQIVWWIVGILITFYVLYFLFIVFS